MSKYRALARYPLLMGMMATLCSAIAAVPDHISDRAQEMAVVASGGEIRVISIARMPEYQGLSQATKIVYSDRLNQVRELIMLPDGKHFIPSGIMLFDPQGYAPPQTPQPAAQATPTKPAPYAVNDIFGLEDFRPDVVEGVFDSAIDAAEVYFGILVDAPAVIDGTNPDFHYYVMFDPSCTFCLRKYDQIRPLIDAGQITVHWIPVIGPSKPPYAPLQLLADGSLDNAQRLDILKKLAAQQALNLSPTDSEASMKVLAKTGMVLQMLRSTTDAQRSAGTPQSFYRMPDGQIRHHYGYGEDHIAIIKNDLELFSRQRMANKSRVSP